MTNTIKHDVVTAINKLYVTYRQQYLEQTANGYLTQKHTLTDNTVSAHVDCKRTIGIKLGSQGLTKFMLFDVDMQDKAELVALQIAERLVVYYGLDQKDVHIDFSGSKGYHITLFFDEVAQDIQLIKLYDEICHDLQLDKNKVEFRPTKSNGVKLPLSYHKKSNNFMCFCNYDLEAYTITHLSQAESYQYFLNIKQQDFEEFKEFVLDELDDLKEEAFSLKESKGNEFESIIESINLDGKAYEELEQELIFILSNNRLIHEGTRNKITFLLSMFLKEQGHELETAINIINQVMLGTYDDAMYRELISADTTRQYMLDEVVRITKNTYAKGYVLRSIKKDIEISKNEILTILNIKQKHLKQLAFSFLIHSKRYAKKSGEFYMTYSTMAKMGNTSVKSRLISSVKDLEKIKAVEVLSRNVIDSTQSKLQGKPMSKPNVYRCLIDDKEKSPKIKLRADEDKTLAELTSMFFSFDEIKHLIPRGQQATFKEQYNWLQS